VGPRGSSRAESNLADGHDENLGRSGRGLGVPGVRERTSRKRFVETKSDNLVAGTVLISLPRTSHAAPIPPNMALDMLLNPKSPLAKLPPELIELYPFSRSELRDLFQRRENCKVHGNARIRGTWIMKYKNRFVSQFKVRS
jgi:hypothetical protein